MGTAYFIGSSIIVRPQVPAGRLAGTGFAMPTDHSELPNDERNIVVIRIDGADHSTIEPACPDGFGSLGPIETAVDEVADTLTELIGLIGPGHTYSDELTVEGPGVADYYRLRPMHQHPTDGGPERWTVLKERAALVFPTDYAIPDGPAVTFAAAAARPWLEAKTRDPHGQGRWDYRLVPDGFYTYDQQPSDWLARLLPDLSDAAIAPQVWRTAPGVQIRVVETVSEEAPVPDGGCVLQIEVGGLKLASRYLSPTTLSQADIDADGKTDKFQLDAAVEALTVVADEINRVVEHHRTARAANEERAGQGNKTDPIADLYRAVEDVHLEWLDGLMVRAGLMWSHDPNDGTCHGHMNRIDETHCGGCSSARPIETST